MSTVMYCWRIKKGDFWPAVRVLRQDAFNHHAAMLIAAELRVRLLERKPEFKTRDAQNEYDEAMRETFQADETGLLALQIFDEGRTFLVRPLYFGLNFQHVITRLNLPFKAVWYDGRVGEGSRNGKEKADWVHDKISRGEYFINVILGTHEPFKAIVYNLWPRGIEHTRDSGP